MPDKTQTTKKPDTYHFHEALCFSLYFANGIEHELLEHPVIQRNPKWKRTITRAVEDLNELYQEIGAVHMPVKEKA